MAAFTLFTELALVTFLVVILAVTADAGLGRILVIAGFVAAAALDIDVLARQREPGLLMIKTGCLFPANIRMAVCTLGSQ